MLQPLAISSLYVLLTTAHRKPFRMTEYLNYTDGEWYHIEPFVYADGTTSPPALLRDPADQNYLSDGVRIAGLTLAAISFFVIILLVLFILCFRVFLKYLSFLLFLLSHWRK